MLIRLGEIIKDAREQKEITRAQLADYAGVSEERIEEISKDTIKKQDFEELRDEVNKLVGGKVQEAEETIKKVTSLLERGLELVDLESSLFDVKTYLEEMILEKKALEEVEEKE